MPGQVKQSQQYLQIKQNNTICEIYLNRPTVHNAFDEQLIAELIAAISAAAADDLTRVILLAAKGKNFSAGADIHWMQRQANYTAQQNLADAVGVPYLGLRRLLDSQIPHRAHPHRER